MKDSLTRFLTQLEPNFRGEIDLRAATRLVYSTDNSIYQVMPEVVLFPKDEADLITLFISAPQALNFTLKGGGTSTNGQSLTDGIVVDCSRYMNKIKEINVEAEYAVVESGVILDQLNDALKKYGYFFPVTISTSSRCTLGGMVNTNACGKGSMYYGRMSDNVLGLKCVMHDGTVLDTQKTNKSLENKIKPLIDLNQQEIQQRHINIARPLTGYTLSEVLQNDKVNLNKLIVGSEGTLIAVTEIKLKIQKIPSQSYLVVLFYSDFKRALEDGGKLREIKPTAIETLDEKIVAIAREDLLGYLLPKKFYGAINLVELIDQISFERFMTCQDSLCIDYQLVEDQQEVKAWWELRKKSVGLLGNVKSEKKPVSGVEDTLVPPDKLAEFIAEFCQLLDKENLEYGMFGHVDAGCLHVRPAYDLSDPNDIALYYKISDEVAKLVQKYDGIMWGEHGKGFRSQYVPQIFGKKLFNVLCEIKRIFDPYNQLNPGKIAVPNQTDKLIKIDQPAVRLIPKDKRGFAKAFACNGNGACFNYSAFEAICPSYKITKDRIHSPKGRTSLLNAWVQGDYEQATFDALAGCLGCKACATQCPIHVDIPTMKAEFLYQYYQKHRRSVRSLLIARSEKYVCLQRFLPGSTWFGLQDLPKKTKREKFNGQLPKDIVSNSNNKTVAIVQDWLTSNYEPDIVHALQSFLSQLGFEPVIIKKFENGKPWHTQGYLDYFSKLVKKNHAYLMPLIKHKVAMIGIDPSVTLTYRNEYAKYGDKIPVKLIQEFLVDKRFSESLFKQGNSKPLLLPHCTEQTTVGRLFDLWRMLFTKCGFELEIAEVGCCGMAGDYGYKKENQSYSKGLFKMSWKEYVDSHDVILATGFSCRHQISRFSKTKAMHPISYLMAKRR